MILLIDNYDSFSYNLYQAVGQVNPDIKVVRNDELTVEEIRQMAPEALIYLQGLAAQRKQESVSRQQKNWQESFQSWVCA